MGRDPKKPRLRAIDGGQAHRPARIPPIPRSIKPRAPSWLTLEGKKAFRAICRELEAMQGAYSADAIIITNLAVAYDDLRAIRIELHTSGTQYVQPGANKTPVVNPQLRLQYRIMQTISRLCAQLGLDPTTRARLDVEITSLPSVGGQKKSGLQQLRDSLLED